MKLQEFYNLAIQAGIDADPRGRAAVEAELRETAKAYEELKPEDKALFDTEKLMNPYADSRILYGDPEREVKRVLVGIDMETPEILLADRLNQKGAGIDLVLAHHPEGRAYANFYEVMKMQADILNRFGVPINVAESQLSGRMKEVERSLLPVNHTRPVDAARLLDIPLVCLHTPGRQYGRPLSAVPFRPGSTFPAEGYCCPPEKDPRVSGGDQEQCRSPHSGQDLTTNGRARFSWT